MQWIERVQFKRGAEIGEIEIHPAAGLSGFENPGRRREVNAMHPFGDKVTPIVGVAKDECLYLFAREDDVVNRLRIDEALDLGPKVRLVMHKDDGRLVLPRIEFA